MGKALAIGDTFDVGGDDLRFRISGEVVYEVTFIDVAGIPVAHHFAETEPAGVCQPHHEVGVAAALTEEAYGSGISGKIGAEADLAFGIVDAQAVGADHPNAAPAGYLHQLALQLYAVRLARLGKTRGEHVNDLDSLGYAFLHQRRCELGWDGDHHMVHRPRNLRQRAVDGITFQFTSLWIHEVDLAGVSASEQRIEIKLPHPELGQVGGYADHRDRLRVEHVV